MFTCQYETVSVVAKGILTISPATTAWHWKSENQLLLVEHGSWFWENKFIWGLQVYVRHQGWSMWFILTHQRQYDLANQPFLQT